MIAGIETLSSATKISSAGHEKLGVMIATPLPFFSFIFSYLWSQNQWKFTNGKGIYTVHEEKVHNFLL
jgi:hypothetical protein